MPEENFLLQQAALLGGDPEAIRDFYSDWADTYDTDLLLVTGYVAPEIAADALVNRVSKEALVLDAGCGTGLVGIELIKRNWDLTIDGIDLTPVMLEHARSKGAYRKLNLADMVLPLYDIDDNTYDGIVSTGVFAPGHVGPEGIDELIRVAKSGAPIVLTVREDTFEAEGFKAKIAELEQDGFARTLDITRSPYHTKEEIFCELVVLEVLGAEAV